MQQSEKDIETRQKAIADILDLDGDIIDGEYVLSVQGPHVEPPIRHIGLWFERAISGEVPDDTLGTKRFQIDVMYQDSVFDTLEVILTGAQISANTMIELGFLSPYVRDVGLFNCIGSTETADVKKLITNEAQKLIDQKNSEHSYRPICAM